MRFGKSRKMEELLSQELKSHLKSLKLSDFIKNDGISNVTFSEGALLTLLAEAKRRNWNHDQLVSYLDPSKEETGYLLDCYENVIGPQLASTRISPKYQLKSFRSEIRFQVYSSSKGRGQRPYCLLELIFQDFSLVVSLDPSGLQDLIYSLKDLLNNLK